MGLFDFVSDWGKKVFSSEDDAAEKIQENIGAENPGVEDLEVEYHGGVVSLGGKASSPEAMEKAVLMAGNIKGVSEVKIDKMEVPDAVQFYTIESGDSLSRVAKQFYGNAMDYPKLFEANREVIKDPDKIYPGQKIRVPPKTW